MTAIEREALMNTYEESFMTKVLFGVENGHGLINNGLEF